MRKMLSSYKKIIKERIILILLFSLILSCKTEMTEEQEVEQFVTEYINFAIDHADSRSEEIREKFYAKSVGINPKGFNHVLVVDGFKITKMKFERCDIQMPPLRGGKYTLDCYTVYVSYNKKYYIDFDNNRVEVASYKGKLTELEDTKKECNDLHVVVKEEGKWKIAFNSNIGSIVSEKGKAKVLAERKRIDEMWEKKIHVGNCPYLLCKDK